MSVRKVSVRMRRVGWSLLAALVVFAVVGFLVFPPIVKTQLEQRLSAASGRVVTVEKVRLNPFALSLTLENFNVQEADGRRSFFGWTKLYVDFDLLASLSSHWVIREVTLDGFHAEGSINRDGSYNVSDLLARLEKLSPPPKADAAPAKPGRPIRLVRLQVTGARVDFSDQSRVKPFHTLVGPLSFTLREFSTAPASKAPYGFDAVTESGEKLSWYGVISAIPLGSRGELKIENVFLPKYAPYYADQLRGDVTDGRLSLHGKYEINLDPGHRVMALSDGGLQLRNLKVSEGANLPPAIELPSLEISGVQADALTLKAAIQTIRFNGGSLRIRRGKEGAINLLSLLPEPTTAAAPPVLLTAATATKLPDVSLGELSVKDLQIDVLDQAAPRPAQLGLTHFQLTVKNVSLAENNAIPVQLAFDWLPKGTVNVAGTVMLKPAKVDLKTDVVGLALLPLSPYLEQLANVRVTQGAVSLSLASAVALPVGESPTGTIAGDFSLDKFAVVDAARNEELAGVETLALQGLKLVATAQPSVSLNEISVVAPYARIVANADHSLNLAAVLKRDPSLLAVVPNLSASPMPMAATTLLPRIAVAKVSISGGDFSFSDRSVEPAVRMAIKEFGGTIAGLSSENSSRAAVDLRATVDGTGPVAITGKVDPLAARKFVDLKVDFRNVDLQPLSPYSGRFAGYELARGKLLLDVKLSLDDRTVDASNVITLNQFTFGGATNSPEATKLPVRLGVALLKDLDGKIVIDVPVQGSLDDPNFRIGKMVWRVVGNLLTKAAVSPFSLVGSMFGGGGEELAFQEFAPGNAELEPTEIKKLETMVKALTNRPGLNLDFEGSYDQAADGYVLKRTKLAADVRRAIWEKKHAIDPNIAAPAELVISADENAAMVKALFDAKFPPGTVFGTPLPAAPVVVLPPPPPAGVVKRFINTITFKTRRERRAVASENQRQAIEHERKVSAAVSAGIPLDEMMGRLAEATEVSDEELRALAQQRAQHVRDYFSDVGKIAGERLFLAQNQAGSAKLDRGPRVFLNLQ